MPVNCVLYVIIGCPMCEKVKNDLLTPYQRSGMISLTTCNIGVHKMLPAEISPEMYNYRFLSDETRRAVTPTIFINDEVFLQAMTYVEFEKAFEQTLREVMRHA